MAMIALKVPKDVARVLATLDVPGRVPTDDFHVTLAYLGDGVSAETLAKAVQALLGVAQETTPFTMAVDHVDTFPKGDDGFPVICPVGSKEVHALREKVVRALDTMGVDYSKKWPVFRPHVTLGYSEEDVKKTSFPKVEWGAGEVLLFGGDWGDGRFLATFPFALAPSSSKTAGYRALVRLAKKAV